jgi:chromosome segregation ATPase
MTDETGERLGAVEKELTSLGRDVAKLRILKEENARTLRLITERHSATLDSHSAKLDSLGRRLDDVFTALEPLQQMKDFVERVAHDHELRITALEKREG